MRVVVMDVDGTLSPNSMSCSQQVVETSIVRGSEAPLRALQWPGVWLTGWGEYAPEIADFPVLWYEGPEFRWWRVLSLDEFLSSNPGVSGVAWCDDELAGHDDDIDWLRARHPGVDFLLVYPDSDRGLTDDDADAVDAFLAMA